METNKQSVCVFVFFVCKLCV